MRRSGPSLLSFLTLAMLCAEAPAMACEMHGYILSKEEMLATLDLTGMTYAQQVAAQEEAIARYEHEEVAALGRARAAFMSRFKVEPEPTQIAQK